MCDNLTQKKLNWLRRVIRFRSQRIQTTNSPLMVRLILENLNNITNIMFHTIHHTIGGKNLTIKNILILILFYKIKLKIVFIKIN